MTARVPEQMICDDGMRLVRGPGGILMRIWTEPQSVRRLRRRTGLDVIRLALAVLAGALAATVVR